MRKMMPQDVKSTEQVDVRDETRLPSLLTGIQGSHFLQVASQPDSSIKWSHEKATAYSHMC